MIYELINQLDDVYARRWRLKMRRKGGKRRRKMLRIAFVGVNTISTIFYRSCFRFDSILKIEKKRRERVREREREGG